MTLTNPPAIISQFATQIAACAVWTPGSAGLWYPETPESTAGLHAVLLESDRNVTRYAEGASGLVNGSLIMLIYADDTIGNVETLARDLLDQLMLQYTGIAWRGGSVGTCYDPGPSKIAGGLVRKSIDITLQYGLSA